MTARLGRIRQAAVDAGADAVLVRNTSNIAWATGWQGVFDSERAHALLVCADGAVLHTDSRYAGACRAAAQGGVVEVDDATGAHPAWLAGELSRRGLSGPLAIEDETPLREFRALQEALPDAGLIETHDLVLGLRAVKDEAEARLLLAAQAVTDAAFAHMAGWMCPGMTEKQVQVELDGWMRAHGADELAFASIVACGPNGANPHAQPGDAVLETGQCVVMDFGARVAGYCSDMTRTVFVGEPPTQLRRAYEALRAANEAVEAMLRPGVTGAEAHARALAVLEDAGFPNAFSHGLGHGVGLDVHEDPVLAPRNTRPLQAGNVVTVEPGIYVEGAFGMRLEDFGMVTERGFDVFTHSTHDFVII